MRFRPRFSIRTVAIFATMVAFGMWWVTWPEQTARKFLRLLNDDKFLEASQLMSTAEDREFVTKLGEMKVSEPDAIRTDRRNLKVVPFNRSWSDVFLGRGFFKIGMEPGYYVQRGCVSFASFDWPISNPRMRWLPSWRKEHRELTALADAIARRSHADAMEATDSLRDLGRSRLSLPILMSAMRTSDSAFSYRVALILSLNVGPEIRGEFPTLIEWLNDDNDTVREHSFLVLRVAAYDTPAVQLAFVDALRNGNVKTRRSAAFNFWVLKWWNIPGAGSALRQALQDADSEVSDRSSSVLDYYTWRFGKKLPFERTWDDDDTFPTGRGGIISFLFDDSP